MNWKPISEIPSTGRAVVFTPSSDPTLKWRVCDLELFRLTDATHFCLLDEPETIEEVKVSDEILNNEVYREVIWRLNDEYGNSGLRDLFGEDADIDAEKDFLAVNWIESGEKELVPHPRSNRLRDYKYQNCLRGFKRWVETYAKNRSLVPVEDRKLVTSHKAKEIEKELIRKTAIAYGRAVSDYWREKDWSVNEQSLDKFCRQNFSVDEKRKYLIYVAINFPKDYQFDLNKVMDEFIKKSVLDDALNEWDLKEHAGRPREYDRMPPAYFGKPMPPGCNTSNWRAKMPKDYYKEFDSTHKPVYWYDRNGDKVNLF